MGVGLVQAYFKISVTCKMFHNTMMCKSVDNLMALEAKICEDQLQLVIASRSINLVLLEDITIYRKKLHKQMFELCI
ncbi:hypothetical protein QE152_g37068 [Popillia japonica]|uniref:Uncharacterized protein n=1 Tax=Popillia japonica TaxID=7064 RepID=A0AAW1IBY2_POPJA